MVSTRFLERRGDPADLGEPAPRTAPALVAPALIGRGPNPADA